MSRQIDDLGLLTAHDRPVRRGSQTRTRIHVFDGETVSMRRDSLATEEPLAMRLASGGETLPLTVTMRTPGSDFELAAGFLYGEGIVRDREDIARIEYCVDPAVTGAQEYNVVTVELRGGRRVDLAEIGRSFVTSSACGVCGKASLDALTLRGVSAVSSSAAVAADVIRQLPERLRAAQRLFETTGGLHGAGLFDLDGTLLAVREDVGRHNAVDKLIGWALLEGKLPLSERIVVVSGRAGYEIAQKCVTAGVPILCAVSAPSSLAVDLAKEFGLTLTGFARGDRFNVYHGVERIVRADRRGA